MFLFLLAIDTPEDKSKFEKLYGKYKEIMYYAALGVLKDKYQAEDALSQALFKIIDHLDKIGDIASQKTKGFVITVTEHTAIDCYRKLKRENMAEINEWEAYSQDTQEFETGNEVEDCINSLPINYAVVLRLRYSAGYSDEEIAEILGITKENVRTRAKRGKQKLGQMLQERGIWY